MNTALWLDEKENTEKTTGNDLLESPLHSCLHTDDTGKYLEKSLRRNSKSVLYCDTKKEKSCFSPSGEKAYCTTYAFAGSQQIIL